MADDPAVDTMDRLRGHMMVALTGAARVAEVLAHQRAQKLRRAAQESEQAARYVREQQKAEAATVRHQTREFAGRKEWWDTASPEQVADAYATARAWAGIDAELHGKAHYMAGEIQRRYGVDADQLVTDVEQTVRAARANQEFAEAVVLTAEANTVDAAARHHGPSDDPETAALDWENNLNPALEMMREGAPTEADYAEEAHFDRMVAEGKVSADGTQPAEPPRWDDKAHSEALAARLKASSMPDEAKESRTILDGLHGTSVASLAAPTKQGKSVRAPQAPTVGKERTRHR